MSLPFGRRGVVAVIGLCLLAAVPRAAGAAAAGAGEGVPVFTLAEGIRTAFEASPRVQLAASETKRARAQFDEAKSVLSPAFTLNGSVERSYTPPSNIPGSEEGTYGTEASLTLAYTQVVARTTPIRLALDLGEAGVRAAALGEEAERLALLSEVVNGYLAVIEADSALEVSRLLARNAAEAARIAADRFALGSAAEADVLAAQAAEARARQGVRVAEDSVRLARDALAQIIGLDRSADGGTERLRRLQPVEELGDLFALDEDLETLSERALRQRPEVLQAQVALETARLSLQQHRANGRPQAELRGTYAFADGGPALSGSLTDSGRLSGSVTHRDDFDTGAVTPLSEDAWRIGIAVTWNLADGGARAARERQLEEQVRQAELRLASARSAVSTALARQYNDVVHALQDMAVADQDLLEATARYEAAKQQFATGTATQMEVWQAEAALARARHDRTLATGRLVRAQTALAAASGLTAGELLERLE